MNRRELIIGTASVAAAATLPAIPVGAEVSSSTHRMVSLIADAFIHAEARGLQVNRVLIGGWFWLDLKLRDFGSYADLNTRGHLVGSMWYEGTLWGANLYRLLPGRLDLIIHARSPGLDATVEKDFYVAEYELNLNKDEFVQREIKTGRGIFMLDIHEMQVRLENLSAGA